MKKVTALLLVVQLVITFAVPVFAAGTSDIYFDTYPSENGERICVDVMISRGGNPSMMQFCVSYNSDILECVGISVGGAFSGNNAPTINQTDGKIYFIWDSLTPLDAEGVMVHIEFISKEEKDTSVRIDPEETFIVADGNFEDVGNITGSAEIDFPDNETENSPEMKPETETESEESSSEEENEGVDIGTELESEAEITEEDVVVWESTDESVAVVENGEIVAVSPGTTTVTVKTEDGEKEASVEVTVKEDGTIETEEIEVITNKNDKNSDLKWTVVPVALVAAAAFVLTIRKLKNR